MNSMPLAHFAFIRCLVCRLRAELAGVFLFVVLLAGISGCAQDEDSTAATISTVTYTLTVTVSGLNGTLVLTNGTSSGGNVYTTSEAIAVTADGSHSFKALAVNTGYNVTVQQPLNQTCTISNGSGTLKANTTITVSCDGSYTISGTVSGLSGSVVLQNNGADDLTVTANGSFSFATALNQGKSYVVTVLTPPSGQTCTPGNNSGVATDNVTDVSITCSSTIRGISGSISNLSGTMVLQNNYGSDQTFTSNDNFTFWVADNSSYRVSVKTQPNGKCVVSNGSGTATDNVSNVSVDCWTLVDGGSSASGINTYSLRNADNVTLHPFDSKLYAIWSEKSVYGSIWQIKSRRYDNSSGTWESADYGGIQLEPGKDAVSASIDNGTDMIAVWSEVDYTSGKNVIRVAQFDNSTLTWTKSLNSYQALNNSTSVNAFSPVLESFSANMYAAWSEDNVTTKQLRVATVSSSTRTFKDGGNGINFNTAKDALTPDLKVFNDELYAAWSEDNGSVSQIRVARFDNSSSWHFREGTNASGSHFFQPDNTTGINKFSGNATDPQLAVFNSKLYAAWSEANADNRTQIRVAVFDNTSSWSFVDGDNLTQGINKDYTQNASNPRLAVANSSLYAIWLEENGSPQVRIAQYDNNSAWTFKDGDGFDGLNVNSARVTGRPSAAAYGGNLFVAWSETNDNSTQQIRVAKSPF